MHFLDAIVAEGLVREHERGAVDARETEGSRKSGGTAAENQSIEDVGRWMRWHFLSVGMGRKGSMCEIDPNKGFLFLKRQQGIVNLDGNRLG